MLRSVLFFDLLCFSWDFISIMRKVLNISNCICIAAQLRNTNEELNSTIEELRKQLATLEEKYRKEEAEKMVGNLKKMVSFFS